MLYTEIDKLIANAMKERNIELLNVLKLIKSELVKTKKNGVTLDEVSETKILLKMLSQREDSIRQYVDGGRKDLADNEQKEIDIIKQFVPEQPTDEEIEEYTRTCISTYVLTKKEGENLSMKDMKPLMNIVKEKYPSANGKIISKVLSREGYHVFEASSAEEGLDIIDKNLINLIVLDLTLPKMDGYEFTKELREANIEIPILMATAHQLPIDKHKGFMAGTDDYMTKPLDMDEFVLRIKALLRRSKIVNERKITIGKVTLDYDSLTVTREDDKQTLPQKEFYLLYKLLSYPDKIFTRMDSYHLTNI